MTVQLGELRFLPWLRRGLAAYIGQGVAAGGGGSRAGLPVTLNVAHDTSVDPLPTKMLRFYGPGDVVQLNPAQVIATDPKPFANDFEPNYLATVAFDSPELPWLFTPDQSPSPEDAAGRLRPWLCLVVVWRETAQVVPNTSGPLPSLRLADASGELPDLSESWAWAHAQIAGTSQGLDKALSGPPERTLSRLICPRRLASNTAYLACVVPAFAAGRQAGLGEDVTVGGEPAWVSPVAGPVELPIYHSWEFATGPAGDFESLVRRLRPVALGPEVGLREMDISRAGPGLPKLPPGAPGSVLGLEGALRSPAMQPSEWPDPPRSEFQGALEHQLEAPQGEAATVVTPPIYGDIHAGKRSIGAAADPPVWLRELNLDPRHRAAAAAGVRIVQEQQEQLMASAWDQAGKLERANQLLREAQLARTVSGSLREKRLAHLPATALLQVTEPVHAKVRAPAAVSTTGAASLLGGIRASRFPEAAVSPPFRRTLRPRGPLGRRIGEEERVGDDGPVAKLIGKLALGSVKMPIVDVVSGTVEFDDVGEQQLATVTQEIPKREVALGWKKVDEFVSLAPEPSRSAIDDAAPDFGQPLLPHEDGSGAVEARRLPEDDWPPDVEEPEGSLARQRLGAINRRFRVAAGALQNYFAQLSAVESSQTPPPTLPVESVASELIGEDSLLNPEHTVPNAVLGRPDEPLISFPSSVTRPEADVLAPARIAPRFPQPMYESLRALSQDYLLPGAEHIPPDSTSLLLGNPRFIEAYMIGLNHELSREFLWRELPADTRTTFFQQFWDVRGRNPSTPGPTTDIPLIEDWIKDRQLGGNATRVGGQNMLVLLIRGELLRRYPTATIYAVKAASRETLGSEERHPAFRGTLEPDLTFLAFADLTLAQVRGSGEDPGWFFVIQEQPTEPRFGFDEPVEKDAEHFGGAPAHWRDLTWHHLVANEQDFKALTHVPVASSELNGALRNLTLDLTANPNTERLATWGMNAAHMAHIALQFPVRIAIHGSRMLEKVEYAPERISVVEKSGERILAVGGVSAFGEPWQLSEEEAIAAIRVGSSRFFVERPEGERADVLITSAGGREILKTTADGDRPDNLLDLPESMTP